MRRYIISAPALQDLQAIIDYFAATNVETGDRFLSKFDSWCQKLRSFPAIGKRYDGLSLGLRGILIDEYIMFYKATDDLVEIVRIVHGKRDLFALFQPNNTEL